VPPNGVYAVAVDVLKTGAPEALATGVMNIGVRPTVTHEARRTLEVHLLGFQGDLYGQLLRVHFISRLRDEQKFDGLPALQAQIARDVEHARSAMVSVSPDARGSYG
jgi:riboflavin kinase / FMN adenylyltransferase